MLIDGVDMDENYIKCLQIRLVPAPVETVEG